MKRQRIAALIGLLGIATSSAAASYTIAFDGPNGNGATVATDGVASRILISRDVAYRRSCTTPQEPGAEPDAATYRSGLEGKVTVFAKANHLVFGYDVTLTQDLGLKRFDSDGCWIELPQLQARAMSGGEGLPLSGGVVDLPLGDDVVRFTITPKME